MTRDVEEQLAWQGCNASCSPTVQGLTCTAVCISKRAWRRAASLSAADAGMDC